MHSGINLQGLANKIDRVKNAQPGILQGVGLGFARTPYPKRQGLANKIEKVKNAWAEIVQGHGIRVCAHAVP